MQGLGLQSMQRYAMSDLYNISPIAQLRTARNIFVHTGKSQLCGLVEKKLKNWKCDMRQDTVTSASAERERTIKIAIAWKEKD